MGRRWNLFPSKNYSTLRDWQYPFVVIIGKRLAEGCQLTLIRAVIRLTYHLTAVVMRSMQNRLVVVQLASHQKPAQSSGSGIKK